MEGSLSTALSATEYAEAEQQTVDDPCFQGTYSLTELSHTTVYILAVNGSRSACACPPRTLTIWMLGYCL